MQGVDVKQDRVVVITGAAGGIGSVLVDRFLANGDTVIATDATKEHLEQLVSSRNAGQRLITSKRCQPQIGAAQSTST